MESQQTYPNISSEKRRITQRKFYTFLFCFFISSFIWLLIKLSEDYSETRTYPLAFTTIPKGKILVGCDDTLLTLKLKSKGFRLLSNNLFFKPQKLLIDVSSQLHKRKNGKDEYFILTSEIIQSIASQINQPNNVISISPDTIQFCLVKEFSKKIPVKAMLNLSFADQYDLCDSVIIQPDSVLVSGLQNLIDSIHTLQTIQRNITNINSNQMLTLGFLLSKNNEIKIVPDKVNAIIPVDKFTESKVEVPVTIESKEKSYTVKTFPEKVMITYTVSLGKFNDVKPEMFTVSVDVSKALSSNNKKLNVSLTKYPSFVKIRKVDPEKLEFILLK